MYASVSKYFVPVKRASRYGHIANASPIAEKRNILKKFLFLQGENKYLFFFSEIYYFLIIFFSFLRFTIFFCSDPL